MDAGRVNDDEVQGRMLRIFRVAAAAVVIDGLSQRHRTVQIVLVVVAAALWFLVEWWLGLLVLLVAASVLVAYLVVRSVILRLAGPKPLREAVKNAQGDLSAEFDRIGLPDGPLRGAQFAWRLARGKQPHRELLSRMIEGGPRIRDIVVNALNAAGQDPTPYLG